MTVRTDTLPETHRDGVADAARERLQRSPYLPIRRLSCELNGRGVLFLRGELSSFYHKQLAQQAVLNLDGVNRVVNEVVVTA